ncbi:MAG: phospholipase D family protein [Limnobacter sp.]|nr:phospholipase D family protein [Limnobacter sp.]
MSIVAVALCCALFVALLGGCAPLPSLENRTISTVPRDTADTRLGRRIEPLAAAHPGKSGIHPLADSLDAFAARVLLARAADRSLDIQYYIWRKDTTGMLLFRELYAAAERGVRVRLLLDDNNTQDLDPTLVALESHPNIEVRLFNPFAIRWPRALGFLTDFSRLNRRMHNKSFTADNQATIIGGRNVGDEYFGATDGLLFSDLDVLAVGPIVDDVSTDFDRYWASDSSYPADRLLQAADPGALDELARVSFGLDQHPEIAPYLRAVSRTAFMDSLTAGKLPLEWANMRMVSDDPAKGLGKAEREQMMPVQLLEALGRPSTEVALISPYFVPTALGVDAFVALAARGVKVHILTNSLEATDVSVVHSGYAHRRKPLLEGGVELYEMRRLSPEPEEGRAGPFGSSPSSLHAKTIAVDRSRVFIGSFNFDPRSTWLNTELGFVIESPALADRIEDLFLGPIVQNVYRVKLSESGELYWLEQRGDETVRHDTEPGTGILLRAWIGFLSLLPIEWML